jgi:L-iditol 2-dehydrogenase
MMPSITVNNTQSSIAKVSGQYLHGAEDLRLESRDLFPPAPDEVQIAIRSTTLCGSDVHYFQYFRNGSIQAREPLCLGHESAGQVIALGSDVAQQKPELQVGDSVALEVGVPCEHCSLCQSGRYNICSSLKFRSSGSKFPHYQGTLQELINHPAKWTHKLPPELNYETGALLKPLAVAVHAIRRRGNEALNNKSTCLGFGAGAVGLMCAIAARTEGCRHIVMADVDQGRLQFALDNGFASTIHTVSPKRGPTTEKNLEIAKQTADTIASLTWPNGEYIGQVGTTFECTGVESCLQSSIYVSEIF